MFLRLFKPLDENFKKIPTYSFFPSGLPAKGESVKLWTMKVGDTYLPKKEKIPLIYIHLCERKIVSS